MSLNRAPVIILEKQKKTEDKMVWRKQLTTNVSENAYYLRDVRQKRYVCKMDPNP